MPSSSVSRFPFPRSSLQGLHRLRELYLAFNKIETLGPHGDGLPAFTVVVDEVNGEAGWETHKYCFLLYVFSKPSLKVQLNGL